MLMVGNAVSAAFRSLLALAIVGIKSSEAYHPWRWIFIIEGCVTAGVTVLAFPFMSDWPQTAKWLTSDEKAVLADRSEFQSNPHWHIITKHVKSSSAESSARWTLNSKSIKKIIFDWKIYVV
jgi:hypothetical protein